MKKRTLTWLLALVLVISLVPMAAMADCTEGCNSGTIRYNNDGTHSVVCEHNEVVGGPWACDTNGTDGACSFCGYKAPAKEEPEKDTCVSGRYKSNDDGTHSVVCEHGEVVGGPWNCTYGADGTCTDCGYKAPAKEEPEEDTCFYGHCVSNNDGTHSVICEHGKVVGGPWPCDTKGEDGACSDCGYKAPATTPEEKPEDKPAATTKGLDNVPKTGDNGSIILVVSMTVLAVFGGAYLFNKKRAF